ncbi:MAG: sigma-70 family RNA polymerase sigma factor [Verrucomicrobiaceae bacterium]|nr:sigma-70 family RNA polymerase sigma factor [Verrucomicrobiaceae bacterium]
MAHDFDQTRFIEELTWHQPALEAFCHANVARREDAREVLQATCVKLWEKAAEWRTDSAFLPWAFTVARFVALSHLRDRMRDRLVLDEDVVLAMADETADAAAAFSERREALEICLGRVKAEQRGLLHAHYLEGRSVRDLSQATGRGESAIKMSLLRLRQLLSQCIEQQLQSAS